ncbi:MAG: hypothetical protein B9S32_12155 [Verrucomicrobia bacterium Tous-C9LFEB]|nr:MAG: hypothetical protein B9S32_12155 [Verrucomicrobia bacterium Tous-C9LFEB]
MTATPESPVCQLTAHRLNLIVPLAIQLSFLVILIEVAIVQVIRDEPLTLHLYFALPYFLALLASYFWLPLYAIVTRKQIGKSAANWILLGPFMFILFLMLGTMLPHL